VRNQSNATPLHAPNRRVFFIHIILIAFTLSLTSLGQAGTTPHKANIENLTQTLIGLNKAYQQATPIAREQALDELLQVAVERQARLLNLMEKSPGVVLDSAIPNQIRSAMPAEIQAFLEQHINLEGELEVLYQDYDDGTHRLRHFVQTFNERISLHFKAEPHGLFFGTAVSASGVRVGNAMALASDDDILVLAADGGPEGGTSEGAPALTNTLGEQRTAILLVNFPANPAQPWSVSEAHNLVFGSVSDFYQENSYGQMWLSGDVFGWFTLPLDPTGCPTMDIALAAKQAATDSGIDLSGYDRLVYAFPNIGCSWSGEATVGGMPSHAWFDGTLDSAGVVSHELGHNLGLMHSHAMACAGQPPLSDGCLSVEYGDVLDRMGQYTGGHFNAFQKERLGWLDYGASPPVLTASASGSYQLEPASVQANGTKAIRVPRDLDPATGQQRWYYLETHQDVGFDSFLATSPYGASVMDGLVVRLGTEDQPGSSFLLDMTPGSQKYDWNDLALPLGATYTDATAGISITLTSIGIDGATVNISYGQASCTQADPQLAVSPGESQWVEPGTAVTYTVTATNNDNEACPSSGFDLTADIPTDWSATFAEPLITLAPGASHTTELTVVSPVTAADGFYGLSINASNGTEPAYQGSITATYVISSTPGDTNQPPVAVDDNAVMTQVTTITIDVLTNDWDPDGDSLQVVTVSQGSKGSVSLNPDNTISYTPGKRFKNGDSFSYQLSDGTDTVTGTVTVSLQKSDGGGKGGGKGGGNPK
jgi:hypothetical protein